MNSKSFFISPSGQNMRSIKFETHQTMFDLTKDPDKNSKSILPEEVEEMVNRPATDYTFDYLVELFAYRKDGKNKTPRKYAPNDKLKLKAHQYHNDTDIETTVGRLVWNKIMVERIGMFPTFKYFNIPMTKGNYNKNYENVMTNMLNDDKISCETFRKYIDHRDWLGLILHGLITVSFTEKTIKTPENVKKLREELFEKYKTQIEAGDIYTANKIEKQLVEAMVNEIKDDPGFDLYASGGRGDINNHMKNLFLMRGGVQNPNTGKYDIMMTSFNDGLRKEDFTAASNSVVQGAYPKAVGKHVPIYDLIA